MQCTYNVCGITAGVEKQLSIIYYECVFVALGIQHAMHMRHIVIYNFSCPTTFT